MTIGKRIGDSIYAHRDYILEAVADWKPELVRFLLEAQETLARNQLEPKYTVVKVRNNGYVSFIASPDFDTASEPVAGDSYVVRPDGSLLIVPQAWDPWVYHGKHLMVGPDYKGFDVAREAAWFKQWNEELKGPHHRIGKKSVWNRVKPVRQPAKISNKRRAKPNKPSTGSLGTMR